MAEHEQGAERWRYIDEGRYKAVYIVSPEGEKFALGDQGDFERLAKRLSQQSFGRPPMWFVSSVGELIGEGAVYVNTLEDDLAALRQQLADATKYGEIRNRQWQDTQANYYELQQTLRDVRQQLADADADAERLAGLLRVTLKGESEPPWTATSFDALARHDTLASPSRDTGSEEGKG